MHFQNISKPWNLVYLRVQQAQKQCSKFKNFGLSSYKKKVTETQKCTQAAWSPFPFVNILLTMQTLKCQTYEWVISLCLCWNFTIILSYLSIAFITCHIWGGEFYQNLIWESSLVHLTWNDPSLFGTLT